MTGSYPYASQPYSGQDDRNYPPAAPDGYGAAGRHNSGSGYSAPRDGRY